MGEIGKKSKRRKNEPSGRRMRETECAKRKRERERKGDGEG